jgi:ribonuclease HI
MTRHYEIYCDASMNRKRRSAGLGLVILDTETNEIKEFSSVAKLSKSCSFTAELFAMAYACEKLVNLSIDPKDIVIYCDCMALILKTANIPALGDKTMAVDIAWEKIRLVKNFGAEFKWIKGHSVSKHNRRADKLADTAAKSVKRSDWR